ncbi:MAG: glycosyltransferase family 2 protein [Pseudobutyrivibrio sp.]|nr:glycosyltransferase family 2 protein [Pseudobutyrivibrio sp.]
MNERPSVSVALAAYNGSLYLREQLDSILMQLGKNDEVIVSYNQSNDSTLQILTEYEDRDNRIKVINCKESGVIPNFENAIKNCKNDIVFLSDQDDVWIADKVAIMLPYFKNVDIGCVVHGSELVDEKLVPLGDSKINVKRNKYLNRLRVIVKNPVQGSCMAFRSKYIESITPIPRTVPMHDSWIALVISFFSKVLLIPDKLILYRQHGKNVTSRTHQKIGKMISDRCHLINDYAKRKADLRRI